MAGDETNLLFAILDPTLQLRDMRRAQQRLVDLADNSDTVPEDVPSIKEFLAGLRTAWKAGDVRPKAKPAEEPKRGRRRPDPLADVTDRLREGRARCIASVSPNLLGIHRNPESIVLPAYP